MAKIRVSVQKTNYGYVQVNAPDAVLDTSLSARQRKSIAKHAAQQALETGAATPVWAVDSDEFDRLGVCIDGSFCELCEDRDLFERDIAVGTGKDGAV